MPDEQSVPPWAPPTPPPALTGDGLALQRVTAEDAADVCAAVRASLPELHRFMPWAVLDYGPANAEWFVKDAEEAWLAGRAFNYLIGELAQAEGVAGVISLMNRVTPGTLEIGYWVTTSCTGRGIARRASALLVDICRDLPGVERLEIHHDEANLASRSIPESLGFTQVAVRQVPAAAPGKTGRLLVWSLDL